MAAALAHSVRLFHSIPNTFTPRNLLQAILIESSPIYSIPTPFLLFSTQDVDDFCEEHPDVVILCSSILSTADVLRGLPVQRLKRNTLFVDVLSVKVRDACKAVGLCRSVG
jgi:hypothetical protein